jgi:MFS family permease
VLAATFASTLSAAPVFFLGAMAITVGAELDFGDSGLGVAVAVFWAASALTAVPGGRLVELVGARRALRSGSVVSSVTLLGIGLAVRSWVLLLVVLAVGGVAHGIVGPASGSALARGVPSTSQGLAFGIKQSAPPLAGLFAGLSVPVLALTIGWRWAFVLAGALGFLLLLVPLPPTIVTRRPVGRVRAGDAALKPLVILALASAFGAMVASSMSVFLVAATVADGLAESLAGLLLALGSLLAIATRLIMGRLADRRRSPLLVVTAVMLLLGALGLAVLAAGTAPALLVTGTVLAFGPGWGWNGLLVLAVVRSNRNAPGAATGIVLAGGTAGAVIGPLVFAWVLAHFDVASGWAAMSAAATISAGLILGGRQLLRRDVDRRELSAQQTAAALETA